MLSAAVLINAHC